MAWSDVSIAGPASQAKSWHLRVEAKAVTGTKGYTASFINLN